MSARLATFMKRNRVTQALLCRGTGIAPDALNRSLRHGRRITVDEAARIMDCLSDVLERRVTFDELFGADESAEPMVVGEVHA